ncbi:MAG: aspartate kinase, partial [Rhodospirillaceae bacterium]|nr:aspartate kinase [Rhodospirillaceae bacterium]
MARIVQKFGGTSVADTDRIKAVAVKVKREVDAGHEVAVLLSAMSGVTNQLVGFVDEVSTLYDAREYDTVVSTGEQVTVGLLALVLQGMGIQSRSWLGWQVPIHTDNIHGKARIERIETDELDRRMKLGEVPVIAGFQGLAPEGRITTLGRG